MKGLCCPHCHWAYSQRETCVWNNCLALSQPLQEKLLWSQRVVAGVLMLSDEREKSNEYICNILTSGPTPQVASSAAHMYVCSSKLRDVV